MHVPTNLRPVVLVLLAAVAILTGCTSGRSPQAPAAHAAPWRPPQAAGLPAGVVNATALPTAVPNYAVLRKNVTVSACQAAKGGWQASGSVANPGDKPKRYTITIFFTTAGGTVIGSSQTAVYVESGAQRPWKATATFHPSQDTRCVLAGVG